MNGKTAKIIRKYADSLASTLDTKDMPIAKVVRKTYRTLKRRYVKTPKNARNTLKQGMLTQSE
jgi:hypothetical protein